MPPSAAHHAPQVTCLGDLPHRAFANLFAELDLTLVLVPENADIPGSHWGAPEAGLIGNLLYARADTPVHSVLHTACHWICMGEARRTELHTNAGGDDPEEAAVCYLQCLLADKVVGYSRSRLFVDMDTWGYSFRLGSARAWFENDADDARSWLSARALLPPP